MKFRFAAALLFVLATVASVVAQQPVQQQASNAPAVQTPPSTGQPGASKPEAVKPAAPAAPVLTDAQKQQIQIAALVAENLQLKAQQAQQALQILVQQLTPEGYVMNEKLELVKK